MKNAMGKENYDCTPRSRLLPLDLNFVGGFICALGMLAVGGSVVFAASTNPLNTMNAVRANAVTHWPASPNQLEAIVPLLREADFHFPGLEQLRVVGSTPSRQLLALLQTRFSPNVFVTYASTEIGSVSVATPEILARHPDCAGRLCPWIEAEVVDEHDHVLPAGQIGRLRLRADGMVEGYYQSPHHTAERYRDGWYYPRDMARIDADGLLYIEGREDDVINIGGAKIYFHDLETTLQRHPAVQEAAAFALTNADGSTVLAVAFIPRTPLPPAQLDTFAREHLGPLAPQRLFAVDSLPRTPTGKVLRDRLAAQFGSFHEAQSLH